MSAASRDDRARAEHIGSEEFLPRTPDAHAGGDVEDGASARARRGDGRCVIKRRENEAHAPSLKVGGRVAGEDGDLSAFREEAFHQPAAEESGTTRDEHATRVGGKVLR